MVYKCNNISLDVLECGTFSEMRTTQITVI